MNIPDLQQRTFTEDFLLNSSNKTAIIEFIKHHAESYNKSDTERTKQPEEKIDSKPQFPFTKNHKQVIESVTKVFSTNMEEAHREIIEDQSTVIDRLHDAEADYSQDLSEQICKEESIVTNHEKVSRKVMELCEEKYPILIDADKNILMKAPKTDKLY